LIGPNPPSEAEQRSRELREVARSFRASFEAEGSGPCIDDLSRFCSENDTTFEPGDPYGSAQLEGRRQVILRIRQWCRLDNAQAESMAYAEVGDDDE
jgi:hypothetical protein